MNLHMFKVVPNEPTAIMRYLIEEVGYNSPGWGVDILINAYSHIVNVPKATTFSTVDYWYRGMPRLLTPGGLDSQLQ